MDVSHNTRERRRHKDLIHPAGMSSMTAEGNAATRGSRSGISHVSIATPPVSESDGAGAGEAGREDAVGIHADRPEGIQGSPPGGWVPDPFCSKCGVPTWPHDADVCHGCGVCLVPSRVSADSVYKPTDTGGVTDVDVGARVAAFQTSGRPDPTAAADNVTREFVQLMLQQLTSGLATSKEFCPFGSERGSQPGALSKKKNMTDTITDVLVVSQDPGSSSHNVFQSPEAKAYKRDPIIINNAATASGAADPTPPDSPWTAEHTMVHMTLRL